MKNEDIYNKTRNSRIYQIFDNAEIKEDHKQTNKYANLNLQNTILDNLLIL